MAGKRDIVRDVLGIAGEFVIKRKGAWEHDEWEAFLKKAGKAGAATDEAGQKVLGAILEAVKGLYRALDEPAPAKAEKKARTPKAPKAEKSVKPKKAAADTKRAKAAPAKPARSKPIESQPAE